MRFPWANIALITLFSLELLTGYLGLIHSNPEWIAAMHLHRITGFAILALFIWKSRNILSSFNRPPQLADLAGNHGACPRHSCWASSRCSGWGWRGATWGSYRWMGFSGTTIHMTLAITLVPLLLWHSLRHRISFRKRYVADRRNFLRLAMLGVAGLAVWQVSERLQLLAGTPGAERRFTGSYPEDGSTFPVTMWLNDRTPHVNADTWASQGIGSCG